MNDVILTKDFNDCQEDDFEIKKDRLFLHILDIKLRFFIPGNIGSSVDLRPT